MLISDKSIFFYTSMLSAGIITYFVPCYTFGKNSEQMGESCLTYALSQLVPILNIWCRTQIRGKIREQKGIEGTCMKDCLMHLFCGPCALVQEARVSVIWYRYLDLSSLISSSFSCRNLKDQRDRACHENKLFKNLTFSFCKLDPPNRSAVYWPL